MREKQGHSKADGLFAKANRKHQIILNFELKRIAVEQKMCERYFAFEKTLILAHREKIISRQKSLGIYRPQTTPDKKRPKDSFFITAVAMETKARMKLPPVVERKGDRRDGATKGKRKGTKSKTGANSKSFDIVSQERRREKTSLPALNNKNQTFAVVQVCKDSSFHNLRTSRKNLAVSSSLERNPEDSAQPFVRHDESGWKTIRHTREGENILEGIENKQTEKDFIDPANGEKQVENIGTNSDPQTGDNVEKIEVKREENNEEHLRQDLGSKSNLLKNTPKDAEASEKREEARENIPENEKENAGESKHFKQSDEETLRRSKSVLSGVIDESRSKVIDVNLRAQSAGVQGRGAKIAP